MAAEREKLRLSLGHLFCPLVPCGQQMHWGTLQPLLFASLEMDLTLPSKTSSGAEEMVAQLGKGLPPKHENPSLDLEPTEGAGTLVPVSAALAVVRWEADRSRELLGQCPSLISVIKCSDKSSWGEERAYLSSPPPGYCLSPKSQPEEGGGENWSRHVHSQEQKEMTIAYSRACLIALSSILPPNCLGNGATHGGLGLPMSVNIINY